MPGDYDNRHGVHLAAAGGHSEALVVLLVAGADVNVIDRFGRTPLAEAVLNGQDECIALLREEGGELKLSSEDLAGKLCSAGAAGDCALMRRYLAAGADPDAADYDKRTALMLAAAEGSGQVCKLLLEGGADPTLYDRWGHSAADEAKENSQLAIHATIIKAAEEWQLFGKSQRDAKRQREGSVLKALQLARKAEMKQIAAQRERLERMEDREYSARHDQAAIIIQKHSRRRSAKRLFAFRRSCTQVQPL